MPFIKLTSLWTREDGKGKKYLQGQLDLGVAGKIAVMIYENKAVSAGQPTHTMYIVTKEQKEK
jgi:hypothetical protein